MMFIQGQTNQNVIAKVRFFLWCSFYLFLSLPKVLAVESIALEDYRINTGDTIKVTVFSEDELTVETKIGKRGILVYPFLGEIDVTGLTVSEIEQIIYNGLLGDYLINPNVNVSISEYRQIFIQGEVKRAGGYHYQPGLTVNKAVVIAGGFSSRANPDKIDIVRNGHKVEEKIAASLDTKVFPGDIITINESFF